MRNCRRVLSIAIGSALLFVQAPEPQAQDDGPRAYWAAPIGTGVVSAWPTFAQGNASNFNPYLPLGEATVSTTALVTAGSVYLPLFGRTLLLTALLTGGHLNIAVDGVPVSVQQSAQGFADPAISLYFNLFGQPAMPPAEFRRYDATVSLGLVATSFFPLGEYDGERVANLGTNRFMVRLGLPFILPLSRMIPGRRTTLELLPAVWFFTKNDDVRGVTLEQDPVFLTEAHLTRDLNRNLFVSLDYILSLGGETTLGGQSQDNSQTNHMLGATLGGGLGDHVILTFNYRFTVAEGDDDLDGDVIMIKFNYAWHPLLERLRENASRGH